MKDFSRSDRLASQLSRELSEVLHLHEQLPSGLMISVMEIDLTKDLRYGKVYYSAFGKENAMEEAEKFFNENSKQIRKALASRVRVRYIPELEYLFDPSIERGQRISELLDKIKENNDEQQ